MTPLPQPADKIIVELQAGLTTIDPNGISGIYVTGSIALEDFHPHKSDVDFLVLCQELPENEVLVQVEKLHRTIQKRHPRPLLNGAYLTAANLQASRLPTEQVLNLHEGNLKRSPFEMGAIALYELKTTARTVTGIPRDELPIDIQRQQVNDFMHGNINSYWQNWIDRHAAFTNRRGLLILFPILTEWAVLGVARQLYTLQTGEVGSKTQAGYHCLDVVPARHQPIIQQAIQIRNGNPEWGSFKSTYAVAPSFKRATLAIDCVNYLIELFNNAYRSQNPAHTPNG